ncbi:MAG: hypothetical protein M5U34_09970 [Chloroflexi bacterium]|nr:hypothetical protein [Chloroflexota bacterium]
MLVDGAARLRNRHEVALFTDGLPAYRTLFLEIFGSAYYPPRQGMRGPHPKARFRIPRTAAHVQIVKHQRWSMTVYNWCRQHRSFKTVAA